MNWVSYHTICWYFHAANAYMWHKVHSIFVYLIRIFIWIIFFLFGTEHMSNAEFFLIEVFTWMISISSILCNANITINCYVIDCNTNPLLIPFGSYLMGSVHFVTPFSIYSWKERESRYKNKRIVFFSSNGHDLWNGHTYKYAYKYAYQTHR